MLKFIKRMFVHASPAELAEEEILQAHCEWLAHESTMMYHQAMVAYNKNRIMFLEDYLKHNVPRITVDIEMFPSVGDDHFK